jgi:hypothetical protein
MAGPVASARAIAPAMARIAAVASMTAVVVSARFAAVVAA